MILLLPTLVSIIFGMIFLCMKEPEDRKKLVGFGLIAMLIEAALCCYVIFGTGNFGLILFNLTSELQVYFAFDTLGRVFAVVSVLIWLMAGIFSLSYMKHEQHETRYYGYYFLVIGVLMALCEAGNLVTYYAFFELLTLSSMPLVLHKQSHESIMAGLKYMFYSFAGAYMVLFGLYAVYKNIGLLPFKAGGILEGIELADGKNMMLIVVMLMIVGFGVKAGMFPMHAWLPTAHPVAPGPASAFLSAVIVKAGVLGIIRVVYYIFGAGFIKDTWVQYLWLTLTLITVFMGSMLAYRERVFKKRLAYSTVSQVSYILFGLAILEPTAFTGSILHVVGHAIIKCILFLTAGAAMSKGGHIYVEEYVGIGKKMPVTIWCYTFAALGLVGIPPTAGFVSKWYLAEGALSSGTKIFAYLGPVVLLISALLTAGYLLPITMKGFYPGKDYVDDGKGTEEVDLFMLIPLIILAVLTMVVGMMPGVLTNMFDAIAINLF